MLSTILNDIRNLRAKRLIATSCYREQLSDLPDGLYAYWAATASREFVGIGSDAFFFARACESLMTFFDCVAFSGQACALPSKAADSVWHAWLRHSPMTLQRFCVKHYRRLIPHLEAAAMPGPMDDALANCLVTARKIAGRPPGGNYLPPLFSTDRRLRMPHGYGYRRVGRGIGVASLDARGRGLEESYPASLTAAGLLSLGLVHAWEVPDPRRQDGGCGAGSSPTGGDDSGSGCGSGCGGGGD